MKRYLLDTSVALLALTEPALLKPKVRAALLAGSNVLSVVSYWEVMLKSMKGNLQIGEPRLWWFDTLEQLAANPLSLKAEHVSALHKLPPVHHDPFDRLLMAQAAVEELIIVTTDRSFVQCRSERLQVLF